MCKDSSGFREENPIPEVVTRANLRRFTRHLCLKRTRGVFYFQALLENYTFLPFSVFLAIFWIFTYKKVPETKNKTFEEILALFRNSNGR